MAPGTQRQIQFGATVDADATDDELKAIDIRAVVTNDVGGSRFGGNLGTTGRENKLPLKRSYDEPDDPTTPSPCADCDGSSSQFPNPGTASTFSHPNLVTFDGRRYIFHGAGDYVLARSTVPSDDFEVQVRFGRMSSTTVSFNRAIAATVGESVVTFGDDDTSMGWDDSVVRLDNEVIVPTASPMALPGDATIAIVNGMFQVDWPDGTQLRAGMRVADPWNFYVSESRWNQVEGLLGNANGDRMDDLVSADGASFVYDSMELYEIFGASWLRDEDTTLFESELRLQERLPIIPSAVITLADLPRAAVEWADELCRNAGIEEGAGLAECVFDVALTGDPRWITGINLVDSIVAQSISVLAEMGLIEDDLTVDVPGELLGEIANSGQVDLFRFDLTAGDSIVVTAASDCTNHATFEFALEAPGGYFVGRSKGSNCGRLGIYDLCDEPLRSVQWLCGLNRSAMMVEQEGPINVEEAPAFAGADHQKACRGPETPREWHDCRGGVSPVRNRRVDVGQVAEPIRRDESQRREAFEGTRDREQAAQTAPC